MTQHNGASRKKDAQSAMTAIDIYCGAGGTSTGTLTDGTNYSVYANSASRVRPEKCSV